MNKYDKALLKKILEMILNGLSLLVILLAVGFTVFIIMMGDGRKVTCENHEDECDMYYYHDRR